MSAEALVAPLMPTRRVRWAQDSEGFHVAAQGGDFVGFVDRNHDGSFVAFDGRSTPVGRYPTLREAQRAVRDIARGVTWARPTRTVRIAQAVASVTGVVACSLLVAAGAATALPLI